MPVSVAPLSIVAADNDQLFDEQGRSYIDLFSAHGTTWLGHANPQIAAELIAQAQKLWIAGGLTTPVYDEIGLAYAQTIDPTQNTQGAVLGNFMTLLGTTLIFLTNLHHLAIGAIAGSYRMLPPGGHLPTGNMAELVIQLTSSSFALGFQLAAPFLVFGFAVYAGLGVLARLMPQLQIFFVAVPLNIMCGFLIMLALIGSLMTVFLTYYTDSMAIFL